MKLAVIPARGGSKRIPRKNIRPFAGKPMLAYPVDAARRSGVFDRILVSTEDDEVASVAEQSGAEVPFRRPAELADDHTGTDPVVRHAIRWLAERGESVEFACCIYATAVFVRPEDIRRGLGLLQGSRMQYVLPIARYPFAVQRAYRLNAAGAVESLHPEHNLTRSQDLEPCYHDAAQFYWGRAQAFLNEIDALAGSALPLMIPRHLVQDIDTPDDWAHAELMHAARSLSGGGIAGLDGVDAEGS